MSSGTDIAKDEGDTGVPDSKNKVRRRLIIAVAIVAVLALIALGLYYVYKRKIVSRFDTELANDCTADQLRRALVPSKRRSEMLRLVEDVHSLFEQFGVQYWMIGGTLLGAVRDGGIILWDDDIDLGVLREQWERVHGSAEFTKALRARGLTTIIGADGIAWKIVLISDWGERGKGSRPVGLSEMMKRHTVFLDVFEFERNPGDQKQLRMSRAYARLMCPGDTFKWSQLFPRRLYAFGSGDLNGKTLLIYGPNSPFDNLTRKYGSDGRPTWIDTAVVSSHGHVDLLVTPCRIHPSILPHVVSAVQRKTTLEK